MPFFGDDRFAELSPLRRVPVLHRRPGDARRLLGDCAVPRRTPSRPLPAAARRRGRPRPRTLARGVCGYAHRRRAHLGRVPAGGARPRHLGQAARPRSYRARDAGRLAAGDGLPGAQPARRRLPVRPACGSASPTLRSPRLSAISGSRDSASMRRAGRSPPRSSIGCLPSRSSRSCSRSRNGRCARRSRSSAPDSRRSAQRDDGHGRRRCAARRVSAGGKRSATAVPITASTAPKIRRSVVEATHAEPCPSKLAAIPRGHEREGGQQTRATARRGRLRLRYVGPARLSARDCCRRSPASARSRG